ncbi:MAG: ABC transporter substrate-binding protein, partial [Candidatus Thermoplasmatota archaeon]|nr:ABC transporter substrate-binding protein [Candidatus Thermoplasmatota archaeon]
EKELTLIDGADRTVTVKKPVNRVISGSALPVEAMRSIGAIDTVVGVNEWTLDEVFFPELIDKAENIGGMQPDYEVIFELYPDLAFWYVGSPKYWSKYEEIQNTLESAGITVFRIDCGGMGASYVEEVSKLGYILDRKEEAEEFIEFYQECLDTINERVEGLSEEDRPAVYYESYSGPYKAYGRGNRGDKIDAAGGRNIFSDISDFVEVDPEEVMERDPEIVLKMEGKISGSWFAGGYALDREDTAIFEATRDEIMNRPELRNVAAVKDENVYIIAYSVIYSRSFVGMGYLAKWFHPELFEDLDPQAIHQEYLTEFQGLDIDLNEHGVFVYPPLES